MTSATEHFDALQAALFGGSVKAADFKVMPGWKQDVSREARSKALLDSMTRLGIVVDGTLANINGN